MKRVVGAAILLLGLVHCQMVGKENAKRFALPNPKLLGCTSDCSRVWLEKPQANAVFPKQVIVDLNQGCVYGMTVLYDKTVPVNDVKAAIDDQYGRWALPSNGGASDRARVWRVEPEKFAIQLSVADKKDEKRNVAEAGTKQVIYLAFGGRSACDAR